MDYEERGVSDQDTGHTDSAEQNPKRREEREPVDRIVYIEKPHKKSIWRILGRVVFVFMILFIVLLVLSLFGIGQKGFYVEEVVREGDSTQKIAIIRLEGMITDEMSRQILRQIKAASGDSRVKGLIIRTNTPGGGVAASDQINHAITNYRRQTDKPVVAFMQSVAASGGYYTSVACNSIIAEPTVITGSIGVIMQHFVLEKLVEEKLGVTPVTIKSGEKKSWPSNFEQTTEEQISYLQDKVVKPAYNRFVAIVSQGRAGVLDPSRVAELADGSIYNAEEALEYKLIDRIGYIEDAIIAAESLAGISNAKVVEYTKPFSISEILGAEGKFGINIDLETVENMTASKIEYRWKP